MPHPSEKHAPRYPFLTAAIVVLSLVAFFIWQLGFGIDESVAEAGFPPKDWTDRAAHRYEHYALSTFMHAGIFHVLTNMAVLWVFGTRLERLLGPLKFAIVYILACGVAFRAHVLLDAKSTLPLVGAGGAISGVVGAWLMLHRSCGLEALLPDRLPAPLLEAPVWIAAILWLGLQALSHTISPSHYGGGGAYAELIAGLLTGAASTWVIKPERRRGGTPAIGLEPR